MPNYLGNQSESLGSWELRYIGGVSAGSNLTAEPLLDVAFNEDDCGGLGR